MFENFMNGWKMAGQIRRMIFKDKGLMLYPILSVVVALVEAVIIFGSFLLVGAASGSYLIPIIVGLIIFYVVVAFSSTCIMMALLVAFRSYEKGKEIGLGAAFGQLKGYYGVILEWAIFSATLLLILRVIESRFKGIGRLLVGGIGSFAISTATMFAVPVILDERTGPIKTIETSIQVIVKNLGSTFGGIVLADLYGVAFVVLGFIVLIALAAAGLVFFGIIMFVILAAAGSVLSSTMREVFVFVLYEYIKTGKLPDGIDKDLVKAMMSQKKGPNASTNVL